MEILLCERVNNLCQSLFHLLNCLITTTASGLRWKPKVTGSKVLTIGRGEELSWYQSWSNSLRQGWSCGLVHYPGGNATEPIWRVLASSDRFSSWTPLKLQHSTTNHNPLANQLWCIDFLTPPHLSSSLTDSLPSLNLLCHSKTDARFMQEGRKAVWRIPYVSVVFFPSLKHTFIAYYSFKVSWHPDCIFEIHQRWQSGFSRVYSDCCCSCWFEPEIIKIGRSSHNMYSNNIMNFQESTTILNACTKKSGNLLIAPRMLPYPNKPKTMQLNFI